MPPAHPVIGVSACRRFLEPHPFHVAGEKYLTAIASAAGGIPLVVPALGPAIELEALVRRLDGLLLTGSPSMVEPHRYQGPASAPGTLHDPDRDNTTLTLIPAVVDAGIPLFAICRGYQEMNVAFGGSLHQNLPATGRHGVHEPDETEPLDVQYGPSHPVSLIEGGLLRELTGHDRITVNSIHTQGVDRLGRRLAVEAVAEDGLIEAFTVEDSPGFSLGVQWHPEWKVTEDAASMAIFRAFGEACTEYAQRRHHA